MSLLHASIHSGNGRVGSSASGQRTNQCYGNGSETIEIPREFMQRLTDALCYAA
jgi:hypothetical protein